MRQPHRAGQRQGGSAFAFVHFEAFIQIVDIAARQGVACDHFARNLRESLGPAVVFAVARQHLAVFWRKPVAGFVLGPRPALTGWASECALPFF